ncbi:MAG: taurine dioxygenase [Balneola sp.]|nr:MAG: taurine dioxygenase [Balneola sp.]
MLYGETAYIKEFAEAALTSFREFQENYSQFLLSRDEVNFRKTGHKIKPVAQMLGLEIILDEYEHAKALIWEEKDTKDLQTAVQKMDEICEKVLSELKEISQQA